MTKRIRVSSLRPPAQYSATAPPLPLESNFWLRFAQLLSKQLEISELCEQVIQAVAEVFGYSSICLYTLERGQLCLQCEVGAVDFPMVLNMHAGVLGRTVRTGQPQMIFDVALDPDYIGERKETRSEICIPLYIQNELYCILNVESDHTLYARDFALLNGIAIQLGLVIERENLHKAVQQSENYYRALVETIPDGVSIINSSGNVVYANSSLLVILGLHDQSQLVGRPFLEVMHPDDHQVSLRRVIDVIAQETTSTFVERRLLRPDGSVIFSEIRSSKMVDPRSGDILLLSAVRDISERNRAKQVQSHLENRYQTLLEMLPQGISLSDSAGKLIYLNSKGAKMLGVARAEDALGHAFNEYLGVPDYHLWPQHSKHRSKTYSRQRYMRPDGSQLEVEVASAMVVDPLTGEELLLSVGHDLSERKAYEDQIEYMAYHDALTGLFNRRMLLRQADLLLGRLEERGEGIAALCFLDLNGFKEINDVLGHTVGDELLKIASQRLREYFPLHTIVARLGGDEFALMLEGVGQAELTEQLLELLKHLEQPIHLVGRMLRISASVGVAYYPTDGLCFEELLRSADVAMYQAKRAGQPVAFYHAEGNPYNLERLSLIEDLHQAIAQDGLELHYQPILDLRSGCFCKLEALARWAHPSKGWIPPSVFIALAEEVGLIQSLDHWVIRRAVRDAKTLGGIMVINLSSKTLTDPQLVAWIAAALLEFDVPADQLWLEVTETALMQNRERAAANLKALQNMGIFSALDDFGMGYSSMAYLKHLPVELLKMDRSFVEGVGKNMGDEEILRGVLALGHGLGLEVLAEGVEHADQLQWLIALGYDYAQGFHIAKPQPLEVWQVHPQWLTPV